MRKSAGTSQTHRVNSLRGKWLRVSQKCPRISTRKMPKPVAEGRLECYSQKVAASESECATRWKRPDEIEGLPKSKTFGKVTDGRCKKSPTEIGKQLGDTLSADLGSIAVFKQS